MKNEMSANPGLKYYYELPQQGLPQTVTFDICVYGGTPAGVSAAIQASRMGKTVALAVFRRHVGGMTSGGLTEVDLGNKDSIGGIAAEFFNRLGSWSGFSPSAAENTFRAMLDEAGVTVYFEHRLDEVIKIDNKITAITFENNKRIEAKVFIDATYEGDLFRKAGVTYYVGREDNSFYNETVNGFQISPTHQFRFPVDPYRIPGDPDSGLLPGITANPIEQAGTGDDRVQHG
ncbi:MAG: FAD-dependent oxidoreductase [bacterium]